MNLIMEPAPPRTYPFPCQSCRGRFQCHCDILISNGWCPSCKVFDCSCERIVLACKTCEGKYECFCIQEECKRCRMDTCICHLPLMPKYVNVCPTCYHLTCICIENDKI